MAMGCDGYTPFVEAYARRQGRSVEGFIGSAASLTPADVGAAMLRLLEALSALLTSRTMRSNPTNGTLALTVLAMVSCFQGGAFERVDRRTSKLTSPGPSYPGPSPPLLLLPPPPPAPLSNRFFRVQTLGSRCIDIGPWWRSHVGATVVLRNHQPGNRGPSRSAFAEPRNARRTAARG